jgi:hypothetical protein
MPADAQFRETLEQELREAWRALKEAHLLDGKDYVVAEDFMIDVPEFEHEPRWFQPVPKTSFRRCRPESRIGFLAIRTRSIFRSCSG